MKNYARVLDLSRYWKNCPDWVLIKRNFDAVIIAAGVGSTVDAYLEQNVKAARSLSIPYATYCIPVPTILGGAPMSTQADQYSSWYGVRDAIAIVDVEPPYTNSPNIMVSAKELQVYIECLSGNHPHQPWWYSNQACTSALSYPAFLKNYKLWAAQYLYDLGTGGQLYTTFDEFLRERTPPTPWVKGSIYESQLVCWQFTRKGNAQATCALPGFDEADYSISTIDKDAFLALLGAVPAPALTIEQRMARLEGMHGL